MVKTYKLQNSKITYIIYGAIFALLFAAAALFYNCTNSVHADSVDFSVSIAPSLNITIPSNLVSLDLNPATNAFASQNLTVSVGTNNPAGYTLTMNSSSTSLTRTEMVGSSYPVIATLDAAVAENNFTANRWGYRFNDSANTNYQPFTTNLPYNSSTEAVDNDSRTINFAAKVDTNQAPGTYELGLDFTAVANPIIKTIADAVYMQDVDSKANGGCPSTLTTGQTYQLTDNRDGEIYYVARLADGNCWMLDNLRLGGDSSIALYPSDTNLPSDLALWTLPASSSWSENSTVAYINSASKNFTTTSYGSGSGKIGVYYNYCAASAGYFCSGSSGGNLDRDVCPKGWRMPTMSGGAGSYGYLYRTGYHGSAYSFRAALSTPLSGYCSSQCSNQGSLGNFWSSTSASGNGMYYLSVTSSDVNSADYHNRNLGEGYSVRCVLK